MLLYAFLMVFPFTGALYGTYEAFANKVIHGGNAWFKRKLLWHHPILSRFWELRTTAVQVPGIYKIRFVGQTTLSSAAVSLMWRSCSRAYNDRFYESGWSSKRESRSDQSCTPWGMSCNALQTVPAWLKHVIASPGLWTISRSGIAPTLRKISRLLIVWCRRQERMGFALGHEDLCMVIM